MSALGSGKMMVVSMAGLLLLSGRVARADSVTGNYSANHVALQVGSESSFVGATVTDGPSSGSDFAIAAPPGEPHPPFRDLVSAASMIRPTTGATKDIAQGDVQLWFTSGTATSNDTFHFSLTGNASALAAQNSAGEDARALVSLFGSVNFFIDSNFGPIPHPSGVLVGTVRLDPLRAAEAYESYSISVFENASLIPGGTLLPGTSALSFGVKTGHAYAISLKYTMDVPHGVDPPLNFEWGGQIAAVPEPSSLALLACGVVAAGAILGKKARRGAEKDRTTPRRNPGENAH